jgi:hypothetical protein
MGIDSLIGTQIDLPFSITTPNSLAEQGVVYWPEAKSTTICRVQCS